jgi:chemotaxis-related protein WspD
MRSELSATPPRVDDCWNRIGVRGDSTCPELKQYVHCRNCPVYSRAARARLDMDVPDGYMEGWTRHIAEARTSDERDTSSCLVFRLGAEWLALPIARLREIAGARAMQPIAHRRNGVVLGLTNVRGELLTSVSLGHLLGLAPSVEQPTVRQSWSARLIVVQQDGARTVFPVDEVHGIVRFRESALAEVPATVARASASYIRALLSWQNRSVGVIDDRLLFQAVDRSLASSAAI